MTTTFKLHNFTSTNPEITEEKVIPWLEGLGEDSQETFSDAWNGDFNWDMNIFDPQEYGDLPGEFSFHGTVYRVAVDSTGHIYTDTNTDIANFDLQIFRDGVEYTPSEVTL